MSDDLNRAARELLAEIDRLRFESAYHEGEPDAHIAAILRFAADQRAAGAREALERAAARLDRIAKLADRSSKDASHDERNFAEGRWVAYDDAASIVRDCVGAADAPEWVRFEATTAPGGGEVARMYRLDGDVVHIAAPPPPAPGPERCEVCDWPLAESREKGCVPGDCSYRPAEGTEECRRIDARRAELRKRTAPGPDALDGFYRSVPSPGTSVLAVPGPDARGVCDYCTGRGTVPDFRGTLPIDDEKPCPSCARSEP